MPAHAGLVTVSEPHANNHLARGEVLCLILHLHNFLAACVCICDAVQVLKWIGQAADFQETVTKEGGTE